ncbi:MAG: MFS transporter, partial [Rickettsiales bacterium]
MIKKYFINKFITSIILGANSGIIYALIGSSSTFNLYLYDNNIGLATIGLLSLRLLPYSFKYLWAPIIDNVNIKIFDNDFGQRKMWIISMQILLIIMISLIGFIDIGKNFNIVCILSIIIAFLSASYDIAMEAYRIELFQRDELKSGSFSNIIGFRFGLLATSAGGVYLSSLIDWQYIFLGAAILIIPCMLVILYSRDDRRVTKGENIQFNSILKHYFIQPIKSLYKIPNFYTIIIAIACYKLSDYYIDNMLLNFFVDIGYSREQIASIVKTISIIAGICGT